jgi:hypothetical protein
MGPTPPFLRLVDFSAHECDAMFDGGMWGLVRLPGTGCARREQ